MPKVTRLFWRKSYSRKNWIVESILHWWIPSQVWNGQLSPDLCLWGVLFNKWQSSLQSAGSKSPGAHAENSYFCPRGSRYTSLSLEALFSEFMLSSRGLNTNTPVGWPMAPLWPQATAIAYHGINPWPLSGCGMPVSCRFFSWSRIHPSNQPTSCFCTPHTLYRSHTLGLVSCIHTWHNNLLRDVPCWNIGFPWISLISVGQGVDVSSL